MTPPPVHVYVVGMDERMDGSSRALYSPITHLVNSYFTPGSWCYQRDPLYM